MKIYDVIVVGSGAAGLFCSLNLHKNINVMVISKSSLNKCNSYLAQGGIAVLRDEDDFEDYVKDTMRAGRFKNDKRAVEYMIKHSREIIDDLVNINVSFDKNEREFKYTKEGAHCRERILHHKDVTGRELVTKLIEEAQRRDNITLRENTTMLDIIIHRDKAIGIIVKSKDGYERILAKKVILATGGIGGLFKNTTNYNHIKGDGIAIATKHSIDVKDMNYIQIHPTALYVEEKKRRFLISEAVRGEGAILVNSKGERFVDELLPRDIVSERMLEEMEAEESSNLYLSLAHRGEEFAKNRFPNIYKKCLEYGFNLGRDNIPVAPAQHYFMGGIKVNREGKTSLENLYAIGETSCTGVHGVNRLASNSLLEALVFGKETAKNINKEIRQSGIYVDYENLKEQPINGNLKNYKILKDIIKKENSEFYEKWIG